MKRLVMVKCMFYSIKRLFWKIGRFINGGVTNAVLTTLLVKQISVYIGCSKRCQINLNRFNEVTGSI